jgi:hypothetical protein
VADLRLGAKAHKTPVPNKIIKRLFGKSCYSSVHLKPHAMKGKKNKTCGQTTEYLQTPEHIELKEKRAGERWVNYKEYGWFILRALACIPEVTRHQARGSSLLSSCLIGTSPLQMFPWHACTSCFSMVRFGLSTGTGW